MNILWTLDDAIRGHQGAFDTTRLQACQMILSYRRANPLPSDSWDIQTVNFKIEMFRLMCGDEYLILYREELIKHVCGG